MKYDKICENTCVKIQLKSYFKISKEFHFFGTRSPAYKYMLKVKNRNTTDRFKYVQSQQERHQNDANDVVFGVFIDESKHIPHLFSSVSIMDLEQQVNLYLIKV